jgi:hypothetical protein
VIVVVMRGRARREMTVTPGEVEISPGAASRERTPQMETVDASPAVGPGNTPR